MLYVSFKQTKTLGVCCEKLLFSHLTTQVRWADRGVLNIPNSESASPTPIAATDAPMVANLLLSRGKYFIASRVDKSLPPEPRHSPISRNYAGVVRDRTPDHRFVLVDVFGATEEFTTDEEVTVGQTGDPHGIPHEG